MQLVSERLPGPVDRLVMRRKYRAVFGSSVGKEVLNHILKLGHVLEPTFVIGDPQQTALREGERRLALSILRMVLRSDEALERVKELMDETVT